MNKKFISCILGATIFSTFTLGSLGFSDAKSVNAQTITKEDKKINEEDLFKVIKGIEEKYLIQNPDGTFTIDNLAYNEYDNDLVDFIKDGSDQINSLIEQDALKFKVENNEIVNTYQNLEDVPRTRSWSEYGNIVSSYSYCSNYQWYWWGYKTNVNKKGTQLINNLFKRDAAIFGGLAGLAATINPAAGAVVAIAGFIGGVTYVDAIANCDNGITTGKGVRVTGWGKPSTGCIMGVQARY